jgi:hypothetical protein
MRGKNLDIFMNFTDKKIIQHSETMAQLLQHEIYKDFTEYQISASRSLTFEPEDQKYAWIHLILQGLELFTSNMQK